jgi:hypothetical protein
VLTGLAVIVAAGLLAICCPYAGRAAPATPTLVTAPAAAPPSATPNAVLTALGLHPHAEIVFLVDTSDSMQTGGLYTKLTKELTGSFQTLARQQPTDQVVVITIGQGSANELVYGPGAPPLAVGLPAIAHGGTTDFGAAFAIALDELSARPAGITVGGVILLSDGDMLAPFDPTYDGGKGYGAPGWAQLRQRAQALSIPVTGYAVPLTTNKTVIADQDKALSEVFSAVGVLPGATADFAKAFAIVTQRVVDGQVAPTVAKDTQLDSEGSVLVTWAGLPPAGSSPLNFGSHGKLDLTVILTALTQKVPLYLTDLRVTAQGLPVTVSGPMPTEVSLQPDQPVPVPVHVTWRGSSGSGTLCGEPQDLSGHLALTAQVGSTWTSALKDLGDLTFTVGGLRDGLSSVLTGTRPTPVLLWFGLLGVFVFLLLCGAGCFRARLGGSLTLVYRDGSSGTFELLPWPFARQRTSGLIGQPGLVKVHGSLVRRTMKVMLSWDGGPREKIDLARGGRDTINGVDIRHTLGGSRRGCAWARGDDGHAR